MTVNDSREGIPDTDAPPRIRHDPTALPWTRFHDIVAGHAGKELVEDYLRACELQLARRPQTGTFLETALRHALSGGKQLRSLLVLAVASAARRPLRPEALGRLARAGLAVELLHYASLVHDDIIDGADLRRGRPTVHRREGEQRAVLCGDYVLALAFDRAVGLGRAEGGVVARAFAAMCEGMAREIGDQHNTARREADYFAAVEGKSAALISAACRLGALGRGLTASAVEALGAYGRLMGLAFQIVDDIHDLTLPPGSTGKPPGQDLIAGIYTLPVLRALPRQAGLAHLLAPHRTGEDDRPARAIRLIVGTSAIASCRATARDLAEEAVGHLSRAGGELGRDGAGMLGEIARSVLSAPDGG
ncbi:polyprenyl synthetase family protein [Streptomyces sp. AV19]|uniref:polyprenyl synthetase family protein n=1 Tax=Streptomyces sp. AV19 TaxID=2793068 RepID=UPI0018FE04FE|nr:polyprenyl synthetase family protein [Streptomyces sp. AV19]MBH1937755.1 polyprenyl synthetase family protein [Streptomyces sp. AV19]MDG4536424.1 polyprenyl synthetase family protein [Streptomyces sp. AV19]